MAKTLSAYRGYTATEIKTRAEVPNQADMTVNGSNVDCVDITTTKVESALGLSLASHSLSTLCTHANIKKFAAYSPYTRSLSGSAGTTATIVHSLPSSNYSLSKFTGYNHGALTPAYTNSNRTTTISVPPSTSVTFECEFDLGELILTGGDIAGTSALGIAFVVYDGATLKGSHIRALSALKDYCNSANSTGFSVSFTGPASGTTSYSCRLYLMDRSDAYTPEDVVCQLFDVELPQYNKSVRVQAATYISVTGNRTATFGSSGSTPSLTMSGGVISSNGLTCSADATSGMNVTAWIADYTGTRISDLYYLRTVSEGAYYASEEVILSQAFSYTQTGTETTPPALIRTLYTSGGVSLGTLPSYDYIVRIDFAAA